MAEIIPIMLRMTAEEATRKVRMISSDSENIIVTNHAQERMEERGFIMRDLLLVLREGYIDEEPEFDAEKGNFICKVTKRLRTNRSAGVITAIIRDKKLVIITMEWEDL